MQVLHWKTLLKNAGLLGIQNCHAAERNTVDGRLYKNETTYIECTK